MSDFTCPSEIRCFYPTYCQLKFRLLYISDSTVLTVNLISDFSELTVNLSSGSTVLTVNLSSDNCTFQTLLYLLST